MTRTSETSDSAKRNLIIREWLIRFGLNYGFEVTPAHVLLWQEELSDLPTEKLEDAFRKTLHECPYQPKISDIRKHFEVASSNAAIIEMEDAWESLLHWIESYYHPDLGISKSATPLDPMVRKSLAAAGGFDHLTNCSDADLQWARKRFISALTALRESTTNEHFLPEGRAKQIVNAILNPELRDKLLS